VLASGYETYHRKLEKARHAPLSDLSYGAVGVCVGLLACHKLWTYLEESQDSFLKRVKRDYITSATGKLLLSDGQLADLADFALTRAEIEAFNLFKNNNCPSPQREGNHVDNDDEYTAGSDNLLDGNAIPAGTGEGEPNQTTQLATSGTRNPAAVVPGQPQNMPPPLGQTLAKTQDAANAQEPTNEQKEALKENGTDVVRKVKDIMSDLIAPSFSNSPQLLRLTSGFKKQMQSWKQP
jgi:hypothetical protein